MEQTASLFMYKQAIFTKILQKMLKQELTIQILNYTNHRVKEKIKTNSINER